MLPALIVAAGMTSFVQQGDVNSVAGGPVPAATVCASLYECALADSAGRFSFPSESQPDVLLAFAPGFQAQVVAVDHPGSRASITLREGTNTWDLPEVCPQLTDGQWIGLRLRAFVPRSFSLQRWSDNDYSCTGVHLTRHDWLAACDGLNWNYTGFPTSSWLRELHTSQVGASSCCVGR
jgi:hypothetical protein